ncbi:hypothetical protein FB567DRAFT_512864, partial [Paraphoma chrysanthemicola]
MNSAHSHIVRSHRRSTQVLFILSNVRGSAAQHSTALYCMTCTAQLRSQPRVDLVYGGREKVARSDRLDTRVRSDASRSRSYRQPASADRCQNHELGCDTKRFCTSTSTFFVLVPGLLKRWGTSGSHTCVAAASVPLRWKPKVPMGGEGSAYLPVAKEV